MVEKRLRSAPRKTVIQAAFVAWHNVFDPYAQAQNDVAVFKCLRVIRDGSKEIAVGVDVGVPTELLNDWLTRSYYPVVVVRLWARNNEYWRKA